MGPYSGPQWGLKNKTNLCSFQTPKQYCPDIIANYIPVLFSETERKITANDAEYNAAFEYAVSSIQRKSITSSLASAYTQKLIYRKTSNIRCTLVGNKIVDHSDVVGALPVSAAPTTSSLST